MGSHSAKSRDTLFFAILFLIPLLFFVGLEIGLRIFHYGPNLDLFIALQENPLYLKINPELGRRYFPKLNVKPATSYDVMLQRKPANGFRVFVLGGSSAFGYPYGRNAAFPKFLQDRLQDYFTQRHVEVVNLAMCAVGSYTVRDIGLELLNYQPDVILIYAGHNEFYGALGVGSAESLGHSRNWVNLYLSLRSFKTFLLVRDGVFKLTSMFAGNASAQAGKRLMEHLAGEQIIPYDSELFRTAHRIFKDNIQDVIEAAERKRVQIYLGDLVSNVRDQAPFRSISSVATGGTVSVIAEAEALEAAGQIGAALEKLNLAIQSDTANADACFRKARCLEKTGEMNAARQWYYSARDFDALRFRAAEALNGVVRQFNHANVVHVPVQQTFEHNSPDGFIGASLMLDHLHPNVQGYFLMAKIYFELMKQHVPLEPAETPGAVQSDSLYWYNSGVTALDLAEANFRMQILLGSWPFKDGFATVNSIQWNPQNKVHQLAMHIVKEEKSWEQAHVELAELYIERGQLSQAAEEYFSLAKMTHYNVSPFLRLGQIYMQQRRFQLARQFFSKSLAIEKTLLAYQGLGEACLYLNQLQQGIGYLEAGLRIKRNDPLSLFLLSKSYVKMGDREQARRYLMQLKSVQPQFPGIKSLEEQAN
ncbi:MAG: tetratricopeptide repeat protein [Candidatus Zhuqueibacterota bacterium]